MQDSRPTTALALLLDTVPALGPIVTRLRRHDRHLADQLKRAVTSAALNLAEADGADPGVARARVATALGELRESRAALKLAAAWHYVPHEQLEPLEARLDRVTAMAFRRLHPRR
jgi:four helix bundle protein